MLSYTIQKILVTCPYFLVEYIVLFFEEEREWGPAFGGGERWAGGGRLGWAGGGGRLGRGGGA